MGEHLHHPGQHRPTHPRCVLRPRPHRHPPSIQGGCLGWLKQDEFLIVISTWVQVIYWNICSFRYFPSCRVLTSSSLASSFCPPFLATTCSLGLHGGGGLHHHHHHHRHPHQVAQLDHMTGCWHIAVQYDLVFGRKMSKIGHIRVKKIGLLYGVAMCTAN